jgi:hypothetical protein
VAEGMLLDLLKVCAARRAAGSANTSKHLKAAVRKRKNKIRNIIRVDIKGKPVTLAISG